MLFFILKLRMISEPKLLCHFLLAIWVLHPFATSQKESFRMRVFLFFKMCHMLLLHLEL